MKEMYARKVKRRCSVRGCKNTDTFAIALTRELGNTVIICKSCLEKALKAVDNIQPMPDLMVSPTEAPALFFSDKLRNAETEEPIAPEQEESPADVEESPADVEEEESPTDADVEEETPADVEESPTDADVEEFKCPHCGQICKSELGLQKHIAAKHKDLA